MNEDILGEKQPRKLLRSPGYPSLNLKEAIGKAEVIWQKEKKHPTPLSALESHLGYKVGSGGANRVVSSLGKYSLLEDEGVGGSKSYKLSALALRILLSPDDSDERRAAVAQAALSPAIFRELWDHYSGELPSDANLKSYLLLRKSFNPSKVDEFIQTFRQTLEFAESFGKLRVETESEQEDDDAATGDSRSEGQSHEQLPAGPFLPAKQAGKVLAQYSIPLGSNEATLVFTGDQLTADDFEALKEYVDLFKKQFERRVQSASTTHQPITTEGNV